MCTASGVGRHGSLARHRPHHQYAQQRRGTARRQRATSWPASDDSLAGIVGPEPAVPSAPSIADSAVNPLQKVADEYQPHNASGLAKDFYSLNPLDAGMRVVLPGVVGIRSTYHVRRPQLERRSGGPHRRLDDRCVSVADPAPRDGRDRRGSRCATPKCVTPPTASNSTDCPDIRRCWAKSRKTKKSGGRRTTVGCRRTMCRAPARRTSAICSPASARHQHCRHDPHAGRHRFL